MSDQTTPAEVIIPDPAERQAAALEEIAVHLAAIRHLIGESQRESDLAKGRSVGAGGRPRSAGGYGQL